MRGADVKEGLAATGLSSLCPSSRRRPLTAAPSYRSRRGWGGGGHLGVPVWLDTWLIQGQV